MIKSQEEIHGDSHVILSTVRAAGHEAGKQEERQRVLIEIVLALDKGRENSWVRDALLDLRKCIDNPRPKEELDKLLLKSIMAVAINNRGHQGDEI